MLNSKRSVLKIITLIAVLIWLTACDSQPSQLPPSSITPNSNNMITPAPGMAVVKGRLVDGATQMAPIEGTLFLGVMRSLSNGAPIVQLERTTAPYAIPAPSGEFFFQNLEPGEYAMVFYTPELNFLVNKPGSNDSLIFDVSADQVLDLGKIVISLP